MSKIMVFLANGFEEIEALTVVDILRRANLTCDMIGLEDIYVKGAHDILVKANKVIDDIDCNEYDGIVLPGGLPGSTNLRDSYKVIDIIKKYNSENKLVAAICAAPIVLEKAKVIDGKNVTSYPGSIDANSSKYNYKEESVVVDGNIITSRGPSTAMLFAYEILNYLGYSKISEELKSGMLYNLK